MPRCRDCKLYDLDAVKDTAGRVQSRWAARCLWKSTEVWPVSVPALSGRVVAGSMEPNVYHRCPRFIQRPDATGARAEMEGE